VPRSRSLARAISLAGVRGADHPDFVSVSRAIGVTALVRHWAWRDDTTGPEQELAESRRGGWLRVVGACPCVTPAGLPNLPPRHPPHRFTVRQGSSRRWRLPKPSPGRARRSMSRWPCSTVLVRHLAWRGREKRQSSPSALASVTARGEAALLSTLTVPGLPVCGCPRALRSHTGLHDKGYSGTIPSLPIAGGYLGSWVPRY
jgi:hypothetical protein